jgi:hypothetical protein
MPMLRFLAAFRTKENRFVSKSAGEICANRHNPAFHLITLPRAIVQLPSVLPSRFRSQIFSVNLASLQTISAHVAIGEHPEVDINVDIARFVATRCQWSNAVEKLKSSNVAEIIVETAGFWLSYYFR